jgi:D-alanyl-D-alanine carboxypeptidase
VAASRRSYPFLRFRSGVNWQKVNPALLAALNRLARSIGRTITVNSGYRSYEEQARLYAEYKAGTRAGPVAPPGRSKHQAGEAVDASIDGESIGNVVDARTLRRFGLATPVAGDPPHVELVGSRGKGAAGASPVADTGTSPAPAAPDAQPIDVAAPATSVSPVYGAVGAGLPGTGDPSVTGEPTRVQTWQMLSQQSFRSPELDRYVGLAVSADGEG